MKGFEELKEMGFVNRIPKMVAVEDYGPIDKAFRSGKQVISPVSAWGSVASSMSTVYGTYHSLYTIEKRMAALFLWKTTSKSIRPSPIWPPWKVYTANPHPQQRWPASGN